MTEQQKPPRLNMAQRHQALVRAYQTLESMTFSGSQCFLAAGLLETLAIVASSIQEDLQDEKSKVETTAPSTSTN